MCLQLIKITYDGIKISTKLYLTFFNVQGRYFIAYPRLTVVITIVVIIVVVIIIII